MPGRPATTRPAFDLSDLLLRRYARWADWKRQPFTADSIRSSSDGTGLPRICSTACGDSSIPSTLTPRALSGRATRPVPTASSSARPPRASPANLPTIGSSTAGWNCAA